MERVQKKRSELETRLADPSLYEPARRDELKGLLLDKARLESQMDDAETDWLTHIEALEVEQREAVS
jgi:ATP-binding cassette subfamily F protein 3